MKQHLSIYNDLSLSTDLYQLTMAQAYWADGRGSDTATFHLFFREPPFGGGYAVAAGIGTFKQWVEDHFGFDRSDLDYLASLQTDSGDPLFDGEFLDYLSEMTFECDVDAVPEGTPVFPHEPLVKVEGPIIQAQLLETPLENSVNYQTLVATKANRIKRAAGDDPVLEFGLRRAQGPDGGLSAARGAFIGGVDGTSNVQAGKYLGIPTKGTHAHSWVQSYESEKEAFEAFATSNPNNRIFLVDTYDTLEGVKKAIEVAKETGGMDGIRLDSGDLAWLSREARKLLDEAGFEDATIVASNSLDEYTIDSIKDQGSEIDAWGVGTNLVVCDDDPSLGGVYKLGAVRRDGQWRRTMKLSERPIKRSIPGRLGVKRFEHNGVFAGDMIYDVYTSDVTTSQITDPMDRHRSKQLEGEPVELLASVFVKGNASSDFSTDLTLARVIRTRQLKKLHDGIKRFENPHEYPVGLEQSLHQFRENTIERKS